ncbi:MAG: protein translocase subunit SecF [Bdellovibrio sp.]|nr:protein translocase subunit SecF [Bdellovibrio sp.]
MFELIKTNTKFDFVGKFPYTSWFSVAAVLASLILVFTHLKYGVDFSGGAEIQIKFQKSVNVADIRSAVSGAGIDSASVQSIGADSDYEYLLRIPAKEENLNKLEESLEKALTTKFSDAGVQIRKVDLVGPKAGSQLRLSGFLALAWALIAIMIYIGLRFNFKYAPGAIVALIHDSSIVCGVYAVFGIEFTLQTVAALLTVIGYSVNDTVIVYDRVRENEQMYPGNDLKTHINNATNETLSRTILTSGTTLFTSFAMLFFGGVAIRDFFLAVTVGIVVGTYSSIYVAAPITLVLDRWKSRKVGAQNVGFAK